MDGADVDEGGGEGWGGGWGDGEVEVASSLWKEIGGISILPTDITRRRPSGTCSCCGWKAPTCASAEEDEGAGICFFFKNSSLRLAFLLSVEGLGFFFLNGPTLVSKVLFLVSMEKENVEPIEREKLKTVPWLVSAWQKSRHLEAKEESLSPTTVIFLCTSELTITIWRDQIIKHVSCT